MSRVASYARRDRLVRTVTAGVVGTAVMAAVGVVTYLAAKGAGWTLNEFGIGVYVGLSFYSIRDQVMKEWRA